MAEALTEGNIDSESEQLRKENIELVITHE